MNCSVLFKYPGLTLALLTISCLSIGASFREGGKKSLTTLMMLMGIVVLIDCEN